MEMDEHKRMQFISNLPPCSPLYFSIYQFNAYDISDF